MKVTLADMAEALGQNLPGSQMEALAAVRPTGAQTDSREVQPGHMFFCLKGERVDGHDYAATAAKAGASVIVAEREPAGLEGLSVPVFLVPDSVQALGAAARLHRLSAKALVVGVTGTAGKTTLKEVLAEALSSKGATAKNHMNLNNQIGLPVSMLNADADAVFWVMEAGISEAHDMDELGAILQPDAALILNVGSGHLTGLGDKGTAHYKAKFLDYVQPGGQAFVSADYPDLSAEVEARGKALATRRVRLATFSTREDSGADCRVTYLGPQGGRGLFKVVMEAGELRVSAPFMGSYGAENVAAMFCAGMHLGLSPLAVGQALDTAELPAMRFNVERMGKFLVINDSYNSNPLSAGRMLEAAGEMAKEEGLPLILVMGDMLELGDESAGAHVNLGKQMAALAPAHIFWKGAAFEHVGQGLAEARFSGPFTHIPTEEEFLENFARHTPAAGLVLFKGSRSNKLEAFLQAFRTRVSVKEEDHA